jgi:chemotaxis family two-component system response regulator PixG
MAGDHHLGIVRTDNMASILIVDDDVDGRDVVEAYLSKVGHSVRSVANGRTALISLAANVPDVVILDVMMPEMNGVEFMRVIRGYLRWSKLPVIVLTAFAEGPHMDALREMGVRCVFTKANYQLSELLKCVNAVWRDPEASCAAG